LQVRDAELDGDQVKRGEHTVTFAKLGLVANVHPATPSRAQSQPVPPAGIW
jgi:hypothetical protein